MVGCSVDIWSLGCILFDLLGFSCNGPEGFKEVQKYRNKDKSKPNGFFERAEEGDIIKKGLIDLIDRWDNSNRPWVIPWKNIVLKTLQIPPHERPKASEVASDLKNDLIRKLPGLPGDHHIQLGADEQLRPRQEVGSPQIYTSVFVDNVPKHLKKAKVSVCGQWALLQGENSVLPLRMDDLQFGQSKHQLPQIHEETSHKVQATAASGSFYAILYNLHHDPSRLQVTLYGPKGDFEKHIYNGYPCSGLSVSSSGDFLIHLDDNELVLHLHGAATSSIKTIHIEEHRIAAAFSPDGDDIYVWSRGGDNVTDYWHVFNKNELEDRDGGSQGLVCSSKSIQSTATPGQSRDILVPFKRQSNPVELCPLFFAVDSHGNASVIVENFKTKPNGLKRIRIFNKASESGKLQGIIHGCAPPEGSPVVLIRDGQSSKFAFVCFNLAEDLADLGRKSSLPGYLEASVTGLHDASILADYSPASSDFTLCSGPSGSSGLWAYVARCTKGGKAAEVRKAIIKSN
ncbi:uncharacterized protein K452DRAFT_299599 [Aplosporella prunicola CBS 121167]|uniref:Protein kinase domain-containing protein n=1 Tax=Aplosporella prunicola CBS 121167 TaxID=1176127 RepID=A0A6A6B7V5_9PEZI|nr:uncharacterized protein K452DRAFT_299599 [Aplosporella prunicola CBS 121167]KAF2140219.1 hypothetical protein K452DRAFT_299599 [Aplosporella prunicola CBS 121167]